MAAEKKEEIVKKLTKKFYMSITKDCMEYAPKIEDAFEIRKDIINNLKKVIDNS